MLKIVVCTGVGLALVPMVMLFGFSDDLALSTDSTGAKTATEKEVAASAESLGRPRASLPPRRRPVAADIVAESPGATEPDRKSNLNAPLLLHRRESSTSSALERIDGHAVWDAPGGNGAMFATPPVSPVSHHDDEHTVEAASSSTTPKAYASGEISPLGPASVVGSAADGHVLYERRYRVLGIEKLSFRLTSLDSPKIIAFADFVTCVGAGMTVAFFPQFFAYVRQLASSLSVSRCLARI